MGANCTKHNRPLAQQEIEQFKANSTLILEMIKTNNDTDKAKANLKFVVGTHLLCQWRSNFRPLWRRDFRPPLLALKT